MMENNQKGFEIEQYFFLLTHFNTEAFIIIAVAIMNFKNFGNFQSGQFLSKFDPILTEWIVDSVGHSGGLGGKNQ